MTNNQDVSSSRLYKANGLVHVTSNCAFAFGFDSVKVADAAAGELPSCVCMTLSQSDSPGLGFAFNRFLETIASTGTWQAVAFLDRLARENPDSACAKAQASSLRQKLTQEVSHSQFVGLWMCNDYSGARSPTPVYSRACDQFEGLSRSLGDTLLRSQSWAVRVGCTYTESFYKARLAGLDVDAARAAVVMDLLDALAKPSSPDYKLRSLSERARFIAELDLVHRRWFDQVHTHLLAALTASPEPQVAWCTLDEDKAFNDWPYCTGRPHAPGFDQEAVFRFGKFFSWHQEGSVILLPAALDAALRFDLIEVSWYNGFTRLGAWPHGLSDDVLVEAVELAVSFTKDAERRSDLANPAAAFAAACDLLSHRP